MNHQLPIHDEKEATFNKLYHAYWELLFRLACKKTGSTEDAYDIVHDLFADIWKNFHTLPPPESVRPYLVAALYHKVFNYFRSKGLQEKHYKSFEAFWYSSLPSTNTMLRRKKSRNGLLSMKLLLQQLRACLVKMRDIFIRNVYAGTIY